MEWPDSSTYLWQLFSVQNAERRGKTGDSKFYQKPSAAYLFVTLPYAQLKETNWVQQKCWPSTDGGTAKQNPACRKEQDTNRVGWDFPRGDATARERALWLLLRHSADVSMRRSGQALWSAITCIPQPQLGILLEVRPNLSHMGHHFCFSFPRQYSGKFSTHCNTAHCAWGLKNKPLATPSKNSNKKPRFQGGLFLMGGLFLNFEASYCPHFSVLWTRNLCFHFWY